MSLETLAVLYELLACHQREPHHEERCQVCSRARTVIAREIRRLDPGAQTRAEHLKEKLREEARQELEAGDRELAEQRAMEDES